MTKTILGISAFYHDSAAALVRDGTIIAAAQEERFSRRKHDPRFPRHAINYCLEEAFIDPDELDAVVFYDHPLLTLDRALASVIETAPASREQWVRAATSLLGTKVFVERIIRRVLNADDVPIMFTEHHAAHAASAFFPSPFEHAAFLTLDGVGEWATTTVGVGDGNRVRILEELHYPHSLGLLYSAITYFCGFKVNSGEYKLMGLAPYGTPRYADLMREQLIDVRPDGSYRLHTERFSFLESLAMTDERMEALFDGPRREPESPITRREMDLAASVQAVTEEVVLAAAQHAADLTGAENLVMAGGVALNCVATGILQRAKIFKRLWVQPAAGDAGGALGAALLAAHHHFDVPRTTRSDGRDTQQGSYLGPAWSSQEVCAYLDRHAFPYEQVTPEQRAALVAEALAGHKVVGLFLGRMEFGPRSLGARSILGDPRDPATQETMNLKIKYRESFRPFAPSVLVERAQEYFDLDDESPYMLVVAPVRADRRTSNGNHGFRDADDANMLPVVRQVRSDIPAVTHVDYSARVQTVHPEDHPEYHRIIGAFEQLTGYGVVVNTSFNVRGEPIVCSPEDAYRCFMRTEIDMLVLEDCVLHKQDQPAPPSDESWRKQYELD